MNHLIQGCKIKLAGDVSADASTDRARILGVEVGLEMLQRVIDECGGQDTIVGSGLAALLHVPQLREADAGEEAIGFAEEDLGDELRGQHVLGVGQLGGDDERHVVVEVLEAELERVDGVDEGRQRQRAFGQDDLLGAARQR